MPGDIAAEKSMIIRELTQNKREYSQILFLVVAQIIVTQIQIYGRTAKH
jgi:hypothetical protein